VLRALPDTNQLVSSLLSTRGLQRQLIDAWRGRAFVLMLVPGQVEEVAEVLSRPKIAKKYRIAPGDRDAFLQLLSAEAVPLPHEPAPGVCRDPDDDYLLGCAAAGGADYLVTGDDDLLAVRQYRDVAIVDARTFLAVLSAEHG
jgi:putative PIN family toxin of toxin-antitoxin system